LGFVVVTHPFHPLTGQRLEVLYTKARGGKRVIVCSGGVSGLITLPLLWTDRGEQPQLQRLWWRAWPSLPPRHARSSVVDHAVCSAHTLV
jgi:hypothetical protein